MPHNADSGISLSLSLSLYILQNCVMQRYTQYCCFFLTVPSSYLSTAMVERYSFDF